VPEGKDLGFRLLGLLVLGLSFAGAWLIMDFQSFRNNPVHLPKDGATLIVQPGAHLGFVARELQQRGIVDKPLYLTLLARYLGLDARIRAGEFHITAGTTPGQLLKQLSSGQVVQHTLTLIEGETFRDMMRRITATETLRHTLTDAGAETVMAALGHPGTSPEGQFMPETYAFPLGTTDVAFLKRAWESMQSFLEQAWQARSDNLPLQSPYEALILASIVEKETGVAEERAQIAGVFVRRLQKGMKLQTDPTVIYGMGESFDGDIRFRDLRTDTPYNTYTRAGLPPTPIAMPGKDAILAVLHPADGDALYFVSRGDGSHQFSSTLEEHNRAVSRYQRKH
jgi:peptidoglycan lytic transglycosylase G